MTNKAEFFILGSVLSGTTLLRNILRQHPNLIAPEETHVFRWGYPFGAEEYKELYLNADAIKNFRKIDGMKETTFKQLFEKSYDRKAFMQNYFSAFKSIKNAQEKRCFDKSPQNVYGIVLIKAYFPQAKFVHIIRNPLNVIASIKRGHPGLSQSILGSINYWKEAILIMNTINKCWPDDIYQFKYENLCVNPTKEINQLLDFLEEEPVDLSSILNTINPADTNYSNVLTPQEIDLIQSELLDLMMEHNYKL